MNKMNFALVLAGIFLIVGCTQQTADDIPDESEAGFGGITQEQCEAAGGNWNECGSPCAGTDSELCVQVCQAQCECGGIAGFSCPEGFKCRLTGNVADEMGVCVSE